MFVSRIVAHGASAANGNGEYAMKQALKFGSAVCAVLVTLTACGSGHASAPSTQSVASDPLASPFTPANLSEAAGIAKEHPDQYAAVQLTDDRNHLTVYRVSPSPVDQQIIDLAGVDNVEFLPAPASESELDALRTEVMDSNRDQWVGFQLVMGQIRAPGILVIGISGDFAAGQQYLHRAYGDRLTAEPSEGNVDL